MDDQLGKNVKDNWVNSKGQDLFGKSITIKFGPLKDQDVVWVGVHNWLVVGLKIKLLVAEARWLETQLCSFLVN